MCHFQTLDKLDSNQMLQMSLTVKVVDYIFEESLNLYMSVG